MTIFYLITVPAGKSPEVWAKAMWDTYGFDYDIKRLSSSAVVAWPLDSDDELQENLRADDITFSTFEVDDVDAFLGYTST